MLNIFKKNNDYVDRNNIYADYQKVLKIIETSTFETHVTTMHCIHQFSRKWNFKFRDTLNKNYNTIRLLRRKLDNAYNIKLEEWTNN